MCRTVLIPCNRDHGASGGMGLIDAVVVAWKVATWLWWLLEQLTIGLVVLVVWSYRTGRRLYRLARRGYRAGRRWYALRPVLLDPREPVAAVTATTDLPTLADLKLKREANA